MYSDDSLEISNPQNGLELDQDPKSQDHLGVIWGLTVGSAPVIIIRTVLYIIASSIKENNMK